MKQNKQEQNIIIELPADALAVLENGENAYIHANGVVYRVIEDKRYWKEIKKSRQEAVEEQKEYFNTIGIMHDNWIGGLEHAIEAVNLSLVGHGCRFMVDEKENILFYDDVDERGNPIDLSEVFGRLISRKMQKHSDTTSSKKGDL